MSDLTDVRRVIRSHQNNLENALHLQEVLLTDPTDIRRVIRCHQTNLESALRLQEVLYRSEPHTFAVGRSDVECAFCGLIPETPIHQ